MSKNFFQPITSYVLPLVFAAGALQSCGGPKHAQGYKPSGYKASKDTSYVYRTAPAARQFFKAVRSKDSTKPYTTYEEHSATVGYTHHHLLRMNDMRMPSHAFTAGYNYKTWSSNKKSNNPVVNAGGAVSIYAGQQEGFDDPKKYADSHNRTEAVSDVKLTLLGYVECNGALVRNKKKDPVLEVGVGIQVGPALVENHINSGAKTDVEALGRAYMGATWNIVKGVSLNATIGAIGIPSSSNGGIVANAALICHPFGKHSSKTGYESKKVYTPVAQ